MIPSLLKKLLPKSSLRRLQGGGYHAEQLARAEQLFLAPPFTPAVVEAVRLISTRIPLKADEASRMLWQRENNAASQSEYDALQPLFAKMPKPKRVLEIGPGLGRSAVFFEKKNVWPPNAQLDLYDATGQSMKYKQKFYEEPPKWPDVSSFCGNLSLLESMLVFNGLSGFRILNAVQTPLQSLPGPYDLIYGFYSIGFHWSLAFYVDDLAPLMHERTVFICTVNKHFRPFERLQQFSVRVLECSDLKKSSTPERLLVLSRSELPTIGLTLAQAFGS
jgi:hypothetical protein